MSSVPNQVVMVVVVIVEIKECTEASTAEKKTLSISLSISNIIKQNMLEKNELNNVVDYFYGRNSS